MDAKAKKQDIPSDPRLFFKREISHFPVSSHTPIHLKSQDNEKDMHKRFFDQKGSDNFNPAMPTTIMAIQNQSDSIFRFIKSQNTQENRTHGTYTLPHQQRPRHKLLPFYFSTHLNCISPIIHKKSFRWIPGFQQKKDNTVEGLVRLSHGGLIFLLWWLSYIYKGNYHPKEKACES
ncbi:MAG: hypothetical protein H0W49_12500 [Nitrospirales bacterium]|nr:hypothetical protein [Nitrospirales bacterium]